MSMRILLITVPYRLESKLDEQGAFGAVRNTIPTLGLAYLGAVAERDGHEVKILDDISIRGRETICEAAREFQPDVVGASSVTPAFHTAVEIARFLREILPDATFVLGGAHATAAPEHAAASEAFDFLVIGEGEETFAELLQHLAGGAPRRPDDIHGLAFLRDGNLVTTPHRARITDLDSLPFPARHLLPPPDAYHPTQASLRKLPLAHIMTSRGCPSRCKFCDRAIFGEHYRAHSPQRVLAEVEDVVRRYGVREIRFFDDTFTLNRKRLEAICAGMKAFRPKLPWTCLTKVAAVNFDTLRMMRKAGCWQVLFGLESGDDRVLETLDKGNTVEMNRRAVYWARKAGLRVRCDFLVGSPHETVESLEATLALARELPIDFAHFNKFVPFPGTEFYRELTEQGYEFDFADFGNINDFDDISFVPPALTRQQYADFLVKANRRFYLRPRYILRRLLGLRTLTEVRAQVQGAVAVSKM